jgi:hypothetical protein
MQYKVHTTGDSFGAVRLAEGGVQELRKSDWTKQARDGVQINKATQTGKFFTNARKPQSQLIKLFGLAFSQKKEARARSLCAIARPRTLKIAQNNFKTLLF